MVSSINLKQNIQIQKNIQKEKNFLHSYFDLNIRTKKKS